MVWHNSMIDNEFLRLNTTAAQGGYGSFYEAGMTSTTFGVTSTSANYGMNINGESYVAYIFANNNNDGGFGQNGDQDIIKCGDFTTDGSENATITLGFEPQWVLWKETSRSTNWGLADVIRGMPVGQADSLLEPNENGAETAGVSYITPTPTGFNVSNMGSSKNSIYMAIRRDGMVTPTTATDVFSIASTMVANTEAVPGHAANHVVDFGISTQTGGASRVTGTRLLGDTFLSTDSVVADTSNNVTRTKGYDDGFFFTNGSADSTRFAYMWKRSRGYFDVVAYTGTGAANQNITHNLGVTPEMMWVKCRSNNENWVVFHSSEPTKKWYLNLSNSRTNAGSQDFNDTAPTSSVFTVGDGNDTGANNRTYVAYLFATAPGVSKVGSFTGGTVAQTIDCGFTSGARFVLIKGGNISAGWTVWDTSRGIVAGNDPYFELNGTSAQSTGNDYIDPHDSGFIVNPSFVNNLSTYIFYAIA